MAEFLGGTTGLGLGCGWRTSDERAVKKAVRMKTLNVAVREEVGTRAVRKLRVAGHTPATLYGHGKGSVSLSIPTREIETVLRQGERFVDLQGGVDEKALVRAVQWDAFGDRALHLDFTRVSADERVIVKVAVVVKGESPAASQGGMVEQVIHEVEIECPAAGIPDELTADVRQLELGQSITAGQLPLPEGVAMSTDGSTVLIQCSARIEDGDDEAVDGEVSIPGVGEPEVIGHKPEDGEEGA